MSMLVGKIAKVSGVVLLGLLLGFGVFQFKEFIGKTAQYSVFEGSVPDEGIKVSKNQELVPLKPSVGPVVEAAPETSIPVLVLKPDNTLVFNEVVTDESVSKFQLKSQEMSNKLPKNQEIILVLYTPGGSVSAGMLLMDNLKALPQKVKTLTIFSASMGFQFVQNLSDRMIIPSGILMSHRASGGMEGEIGGEFDVRFNAVKRQIEYLDRIAAKRMKMSLETYRELISDEYWVHGFEAVDDRAADKLILARCGKEMTGTEDKEFMTMFGPINVTFSKCPLIVAPLDVKFGRVAPEGEDEMRTYMNLLYQNPREFWKSYIKTDKYEKILLIKK